MFLFVVVGVCVFVVVGFLVDVNNGAIVVDILIGLFDGYTI